MFIKAPALRDGTEAGNGRSMSDLCWACNAECTPSSELGYFIFRWTYDATLLLKGTKERLAAIKLELYHHLKEKIRTFVRWYNWDIYVTLVHE